MAIIKIPVPVVVAFDGDPLMSAALAFYVIWLITTLVQWGQSTKAMSNPLNAPRRTLFGLLLGGTVCLTISYGFHIGRIVIENSESDASDEMWVAFYAIDAFLRLGGEVLVYLSLFLAIYHRVAIYVGPSQVWFIKKIVDGVFIGLWALLFVVEVAWFLAGYVGHYIDGTISTLDYSRRSNTTRSLDIAGGTFYIIVNIAATAGIIMLNSFSKNAQDRVVRTLLRAMLPVVVFRAIWTMISVIVGDLPGVIRTVYQSHSMALADAILDQLSLAILIGIMLRLGFNHEFWDAPTGVTAQPGSVPQQSYGAQGMVEGHQGMTMMIGPNGLPILGPNGQPMFAPAQGQEAWKQSMYSPSYQHNVIPYGQFTPQQPQFALPQQQQHFSHLPQPPAGYSYQPPGSTLSGSQSHPSPNASATRLPTTHS